MKRLVNTTDWQKIERPPFSQTGTYFSFGGGGLGLSINKSFRGLNWFELSSSLKYSDNRAAQQTPQSQAEKVSVSTAQDTSQPKAA